MVERYDIQTKDYHYGASMVGDETGDWVRADDFDRMRRRLLRKLLLERARLRWSQAGRTRHSGTALWNADWCRKVAARLEEP